MTAPTHLGDEDDDLLPHGGPEHHTYRAPNGDIRCTACPLEVGRPAGMPDYTGAAMAGWGRPWWARLLNRWQARRYRRKLIRYFSSGIVIVRPDRPS